MNNTEKNYRKEIESLLKERKSKEAIIKKQENKLMELKAHKKTIVSALCGNNISYHYPKFLNYRKDGDSIYINDKFPFYILNRGTVINSDNEIAYPDNYKIIRKFIAHKNSKSTHSNIFYTSSILIKNYNEKWFTIKDDENNLLQGKNIFEQFKQWFDFELPFKSIEEWLGLTSHQVINYLYNND